MNFVMPWWNTLEKYYRKNCPEITWAVTEHNISDDQKVALSSCKWEAINDLKLHTQNRERTHHAHIPTKQSFTNKNTKSVAHQIKSHKSHVRDLKMTIVREDSDTV